MNAFGEMFKKNPDFYLEVKFMIAEEDMAAVYLKAVTPVGKTTCRVVDLYRLEDEMLAEHLDVLQNAK